MPATEVRLFKDANGTEPVREWLDNLSNREPKAHTKCLDTILQLAEKGHDLRRPVCDFLRNGIYELRPRVGKVHYRILYFFFDRHCAALAVGIRGKKGRVNEHLIDIAIENRTLVEADPDRYTSTFGL